MSEPKGTWLKVFCPDARCLTEGEIESLPPETKQAASDKDGLWLELFCPGQACAPEEVTGVKIVTAQGKDKWLSVFCPEGACAMKTSGTEVV